MRKAAAFCCLFFAFPAFAGEEFPSLKIHGLLDLRVAHTDEQIGWLDRGLGKTRFGGKRGEGHRTTGSLGEASVVLRPRFSWHAAGHLHIKADKDQKSPLDIVEGFLSYRPVSTSAWQFSAKIGAFFPPGSLKNIDVAWQSPYAISWSAINSWIGEEVRATGAEIAARHRYEGGGVSFGGALFGGNDPAGTILHQRGWALHDRHTGMFDAIPLPSTTANFEVRGDIEPFKEIDDTPGFYLFARGEDEDIGGEFLITAYDNLADEAATRRGRGAWRTRFLSAGVGYFLPYDIEFLSQVMYGDTERLTPGGIRLDATFVAAYLMMSRFVDADEKHQLSLRYDWFKTDDENILPNRTPVDEVGDAWTFAYSYRPTEDHRLSFEILSVKSRRSARVATAVSAKQRDTTLQTSYRFSF